jgi:hypothetical protein
MLIEPREWAHIASNFGKTRSTQRNQLFQLLPRAFFVVIEHLSLAAPAAIQQQLLGIRLGLHTLLRREQHEVLGFEMLRRVLIDGTQDAVQMLSI